MMKLKFQLKPLARIRGWIAALIVSATLSPSFAGEPVSVAMASPSDTVNVVLKEWNISLYKQVVNSGHITFRVNNHSTKEHHELVIIKTDRSYADLPVKHGKVVEADAGDLIGEIEELAPGETQEQTFTLAPGDYVLFCNLVETEEDGELESHYMEGMHVAFKVLP